MEMKEDKTETIMDGTHFQSSSNIHNNRNEMTHSLDDIVKIFITNTFFQ